MINKLVLTFILIFLYSCNQGVEREQDNSSSDSLIGVLDTVFEDDQSLRRKIFETDSLYGKDSQELKLLRLKQTHLDSINLIKVEKFLSEYGLPGADKIGWKSNAALFFVIQHADINTQKRYLPLMKDAASKGNARADYLALLEDRIAIRLGKKQIYGSQIGRNIETGEFYVLPLEDPDNVDRRRSQVGLNSIQEYVGSYNIDWSLEQYYKDLEKSSNK